MIQRLKKPRRLISNRGFVHISDSTGTPIEIIVNCHSKLSDFFKDNFRGYDKAYAKGYAKGYDKALLREHDRVAKVYEHNKFAKYHTEDFIVAFAEGEFVEGFA